MRDRDQGPPRDPLIRSVHFPLGQLAMTPGVEREVPPSELAKALRRHANRDWGDLCEEDRAANDRALQDGSRLFSAYHTTSGTKFWVITEADRSITTALLPDEY